MTSKVGNIRMTRTKQALIDAFGELINEKSFEKITILDLTKKAQINRATFYAHFKDKYELMDHTIGDSAHTTILNHTNGVVAFNHETISQLLFAVCGYYQQFQEKCKRSDVVMTTPLLKDKMIKALKEYLSKCLKNDYTERERELYIPIYANIIYEAGYLWGTEQVLFEREELANKIAVLMLSNA